MAVYHLMHTQAQTLIQNAETPTTMFLVSPGQELIPKH